MKRFELYLLMSAIYLAPRASAGGAICIGTFWLTLATMSWYMEYKAAA